MALCWVILVTDQRSLENKSSGDCIITVVTIVLDASLWYVNVFNWILEVSCLEYLILKLT